MMMRRDTPHLGAAIIVLGDFDLLGFHSPDSQLALISGQFGKLHLRK